MENLPTTTPSGDENQNVSGSVSTETESTAVAVIRKKIMRFTTHHDILLLREVVAQNPIAVPHRESGKAWGRPWLTWTTRFTLIVAGVENAPCYFWTTTRRKILEVCGEEEYKEKEQLLQEIKELEQDKGVLQVLQNTKATESDREKASEIRRRAMETLRQSGAENDNSNNNNDDDEVPSRKAKRSRLSSAAASQNVLLYMKEKHESDAELRRQEISLKKEELTLERQRIELDRQRLEMEKKEREERFRLESQERNVILDLLKKKLL